jgi:hypothetical protein
MAEQPLSVFVPPKTPPANPSPAVPEMRTSHVRSATSVDGVRSSPDITPAQQRWADQQRAIEKMDPWKDTQNTVIFKDPITGVLQSRPRNGGGQQNAAPGEAQTPQPPIGPATVADNSKLRIGELELSEADVRGIMERKSLEDSRRAQMPATPGEYSLNLPEDFKGAGEWVWNLNDPTAAASLGMLKEYAHSVGLDQSSFSKLLGIYAGHAVAEERRFNEAKAAELGKLGTNAPGRVDAVNRWLESQLPSDLARALRMSMHTAKAVEGYERLMQRFSSQGMGSGFSGAGRDGGEGGHDPARLTDEQYGKLTYSQKAEYAARFDQSRHQR